MNNFIQKTQSNDLRYERKYLVLLQDVSLLLTKVKQLPFYSKYPPRKINNIYFDTTDYDNYQQSINGFYKRKKIRVRWYNNDLASAQLEIKHKQGELGFKEICFLDGRKNLTKFVRQKTKLQLNKVLENSYKRFYFEHFHRPIRLTIDTDLVFNKHTIFGKQVMELKYPNDDRLHQLVSDLINNFPVQLSQVSKYTWGIRQSVL